MRLSEICIRRPVLAIVMNLIIILLGIVSFQRLTVREYPNIDIPVISIETLYTGANPELIETQVTTPLEESLAGVEGLNYMISHSRPEKSEIILKFLVNHDPNTAISDVRDRISRVRDRLPKDIREPVITKVEANAEPILWLAFSTSLYTPLEVTDIVNRMVKDRIQTLPGVANIMIFGERKYSMRIWLDAVRLAAHHLTPLDVEEALRAQNLELPAGRIQGSSREFNVLTATDLNTPEQFGNIILKNVPLQDHSTQDNSNKAQSDHRNEHNEHLVRLKEVATIEVAHKEDRQIARYNGKESVALGVVKQSTANPLEVSKRLQALLPAIIQTLPKGITVEMAYDASVYISSSIHAVFKTLFEAIVLVILVIFLFLRSFRATFIPLVTIPISLISAFILMYAFRFSINTITLLAMVLAIGLVVDDAIVVLENIFRHIEAGMNPIKAAIKGIREIRFAVIAMTLTLVFVFTPIAFAQGQTGRLFVEFALTLAATVLISGFTALTLSPMMCARLLRSEKSQSHFSIKIETGLNSLTQKYQKILNYILHHKRSVFFVLAATFCAIGILFHSLKSELAPTEDKGYFYVLATTPQGSTLKYTENAINEMEKLYDEIPDIQNHFSAVGYPIVSRAISYVTLEDWNQRKTKQQDIVASLVPKMYQGIPTLMAFPINPAPFGQNDASQPLEIVIQTTRSYNELKIVLENIMEKLKKSNLLQNVDSDLHLNAPQLKVTVNRDKIATAGVSVEDVVHTIESLISGRQVTRYKRVNEQFDVIVQAPEKARQTPQDIYGIYVRDKHGNMIALSNLVQLEETVSASELHHFNKLRSATITASLGPNVGLSQAIHFVENTIRSSAPASFQMDYAGTSREFLESQNTLTLIFVLALCFIYLILAAQFESFMMPLVILISVPLAIVGALLTLKLSGGSLNIYSQIGLITLIGLITKHGILIVEFFNQLKAKGMTALEAILEASTLRLRPILMTTAAMVLGAIPLAFASGAGAEARQQMGIVIVGGLLVGTFFTLFVVPVILAALNPKS